MIKVLHYIGSLAQGGSQAMVMNLYREIDKSQIQFDFVIHADGITPLAEEAQALGATIYTCPQFRFFSAAAYCRWWWNFFTSHGEYQIVHSHVRSTAAIVLWIAKRFNCTAIAHSHSTNSGTGFRAMVKNCIQYPIRYIADYFMACSLNAGQWLYGKNVCTSNRYFTVQNAIDAQSYTFDPGIAEQVRKVLGYSQDDFVIGHVGRFTEPKNHRFLLELFRLVHEKDARYRLLLVGDGELRGEIERMVREYGLEGCVQMTGVRKDVNRLMMAMDLFVFPSKWEGLGIVMIEAQAAGCPCIASDGVPQEAKISDLASFLSLDQPAEYWAERILTVEKEERKNMYQTVVNSGYDIHETARWIQEFYSKR